MERECVVGAIGPKLLERIRSSSSELIVVSPFIDVFGINVLKELVDKGVKVTVITSDRTVEEDIIKKLVEMGVDVYVSRELIHTKIYIIDGNEAYTSSANLTKAALTGQNIEHLCKCSVEVALEMVKELKEKHCTKIDMINTVIKELTRPIILRIHSSNERVSIVEISESPIKMIISKEPLGIAFVKNNKAILIRRGVYAEPLRDLIENGFDIASVRVHIYEYDEGELKELNVVTDVYVGSKNLEHASLDDLYAKPNVRSSTKRDIVKDVVVNYWNIADENVKDLPEIVEFFRWLVYIVLRELFLHGVKELFVDVVKLFRSKALSLGLQGPCEVHGELTIVLNALKAELIAKSLFEFVPTYDYETYERIKRSKRSLKNELSRDKEWRNALNALAYGLKGVAQSLGLGFKFESRIEFNYQ